MRFAPNLQMQVQCKLVLAQEKLEIVDKAFYFCGRRPHIRPQLPTDRRTAARGCEMARRKTGKAAFDLEKFIPYLLNRVGIRIAMEFSRELGPQRLKYSSWRVLFTLAHTGPRYLVELAASANFDISTLSRVVAALGREGLIKRVNGDVGARNRRITLSARGQRIVAKFTPAMLSHEAAALEGFSPAEQRQLVSMLGRLHQNIERFYATKK
jgi:DNA-binding MarR family transcriptional regulator